MLGNFSVPNFYGFRFWVNMVNGKLNMPQSMPFTGVFQVDPTKDIRHDTAEGQTIHIDLVKCSCIHERFCIIPNWLAKICSLYHS